MTGNLLREYGSPLAKDVREGERIADVVCKEIVSMPTASTFISSAVQQGTPIDIFYTRNIAWRSR